VVKIHNLQDFSPLRRAVFFRQLVSLNRAARLVGGLRVSP